MLCFYSQSLFSKDLVSFHLDKDKCILGESLVFSIIVKSEKQGVKVDFLNIKWNGKAIEFVDGVTPTYFTSIVNGQINRKIIYKYNYKFEFIPNKVGLITLNKSQFKFNNNLYFLEPLNFNVFAIPTDKNFVVFLNIINKREYYYPTEIFELEVSMGLNKFTGLNRLVIENLGFLKELGLEYIKIKNTNSKIIINGKVYGVNLNNGSHSVKTPFSFMANFKLRFRVIKPKVYKISNCIFKASIKTGKFVLKRSFFGTKNEAVTKVIYALPNDLQLVAKALPNDNVPLSFDGAIGAFTISALSNNSMGVKVGDPVSILLTVKGNGAWDFVHAPPLHKLKSFTDYFRISQEAPVGDLLPNNQGKQFKIKMRVKSKTVTEIPAIPFTYYSIKNNKYMTTYTKAIPLKVFSNSEKVNIINFKNINKIGESSPASNKNNLKSIGNPVDKSIKIDLPKIETRSNFIDKNRLSENHSVNIYFLFLSMIPLIVLVIMQMFHYFNNRGDSSLKSNEQRSKTAGKNYLEELSKLNLHNSSSHVYNEMGMVLEKFLKDKLLDDSAKLDDHYLKECLDKNLISEDNFNGMKILIDELDQQRYSSQSYDDKQAIIILDKVKDCIQKW